MPGLSMRGRSFYNTEMMAGRRKHPSSGASEASVRTLLRGLAILEALASSHGLNLSEVARKTRLPVSTTHRLLETLRRRGFVQPLEDSRYRVGLRAFEVGMGFLRGQHLTEAARPAMVELVDRVRETANLAVRDGGEAVYVLQVESDRMLRLFAQPGARHPLYCTGVGKVLLAWEPEEQVRALLGPGPLPRYTLRARGYAVDREEREVGVRCVAAPVRDLHGRVVAALSVSAPASRLPHRRIPQVAATVVAAAREVSRRLGFSVGRISPPVGGNPRRPSES
jgi:IclR family acetate operon transcriptional repressor